MQIPETWLANEPDAIQLAARVVARQMSGCAAPECHACRANMAAVVDLIRAVRQASLLALADQLRMEEAAHRTATAELSKG